MDKYDLTLEMTPNTPENRKLLVGDYGEGYLVEYGDVASGKRKQAIAKWQGKDFFYMTFIRRIPPVLEPESDIHGPTENYVLGWRRVKGERQ